MKKLLLFLFLCSMLISAQTDSGFIRGADVSYIPQIEDIGGVYFSDSIQTDPLEIFKQSDFNYIRLRLWHTPPGGYCGLAETLEMAARLKQKGFKFLLDFHYSDTWADPSNQQKPAAWDTLSFELLNDSLYAYTLNVLRELDSINALPDMVQVGNEIIGGMLWPDGRLQGDDAQRWKNFTDLLKSAIQGVRDALPDTTIPVMIHIDKGGNNSVSRWFFDHLNSAGVQFDVIGQSFYPWWHGTLAQLEQNLNDLAVRYNQSIVVVETAYPWTLNWYDNVNNIIGLPAQLHSGYPASVEGQAAFLGDIIEIVKNLPDGKGAGIFYWEPAYISAVPLGSSWENLTLFDFQGNVLTSVKVFRDTTISSAEEIKPVSYFVLHQNYPNPFNSITRINYYLEDQAKVIIEIFNYLGERINVLLEQVKNKGEHSVDWNGKDSEGNVLPSGVYLIRVSAGSEFKSIKAVLLK